MRNELMNGFTEDLGLMVREDGEQFGITSLQIVDWTGKGHDNILKDIRKEIKALEEIGNVIFHECYYQPTSDGTGRKYPMYKMGKDGVMQLAMKYDAKIRYNIIQKLKELDEQVKHLKNNVNEVTKIAVSEDSQKQRILEMNKLNFSERMVRKSFYNCTDYNQYKELHTRFMEYIKPMDATTRLSKMGYAVLGMEQLRKNLFANQSGRIGDVVNIDEDIKCMLKTIDKVNNKSLGGEKAAQTRNNNKLQQQLLSANSEIETLEHKLKNSILRPSPEEFATIKVHGFSHNSMYVNVDETKKIRTDKYNNWIRWFPKYQAPPKEHWNVDWNKPIEVFLNFVALEKFDIPNLEKSALDMLITNIYGEDDKIVKGAYSIGVGICDDWKGGSISFYIRNMDI